VRHALQRLSFPPFPSMVVVTETRRGGNPGLLTSQVAEANFLERLINSDAAGRLRPPDLAELIGPPNSGTSVHGGHGHSQQRGATLGHVPTTASNAGMTTPIAVALAITLVLFVVLLAVQSARQANNNKAASRSNSPILEEATTSISTPAPTIVDVGSAYVDDDIVVGKKALNLLSDVHDDPEDTCQTGRGL